MKIRDEIEKLRIPRMPKDGYKAWGGENASFNYGIHREKTNKTLDDVLSILDKWECVEKRAEKNG